MCLEQNDSNFKKICRQNSGDQANIFEYFQVNLSTRNIFRNIHRVRLNTFSLFQYADTGYESRVNQFRCYVQKLGGNIR